MSGDAEKYRRVRRQDKVSTAWDDGRATQADLRRLADVQAAKRARQGEPSYDASAQIAQPVPRPISASPTAAEIADADGHAAANPGESGRVDPSLRLEKSVEDTPARPEGEFSILVVCTGNVCRSPYFERVLSHELKGLPVAVSGAGTGALLIDRMTSGSAELLRARGIEPEGFVPRQLTSDMVADADLVLTATREHRRVVVEEAPSGAAKVFALLDFADACATRTEQGHGVDALRAFVARARAGLSERRSARSEEGAAVLDPFRQGPEMFAQMGAQSDPALAAVAATVRAFLDSE